uniref:DUF7935 family protein n=2 Tax=Roseivirga sp. TaxID=1964215 RepID=UPI004047B526
YGLRLVYDYFHFYFYKSSFVLRSKPTMDNLTDLIQILVPAGLVLYVVFLVVRSFLQKQFDAQLVGLRMKATDTLLPIRLQAYERICLLLERVSPNNMLLRLSDPNISAFDFQQILLVEIREELNHNLSQQVYMSDEAWNKVRATLNLIISIIQDSSQEMTNEKSSIDLAQKIFDKMMKLDSDPVGDTLTFVKNEIRQIF